MKQRSKVRYFKVIIWEQKNFHEVLILLTNMTTHYPAVLVWEVQYSSQYIVERRLQAGYLPSCIHAKISIQVYKWFWYKYLFLIWTVRFQILIDEATITFILYLVALFKYFMDELFIVTNISKISLFIFILFIYWTFIDTHLRPSSRHERMQALVYIESLAEPCAHTAFMPIFQHCSFWILAVNICSYIISTENKSINVLCLSKDIANCNKYIRKPGNVL